MIDTLYQIADELRGVANLGLLFTQNEYDKERCQKVLRASAHIIATLGASSSTEVLDQYR